MHWLDLLWLTLACLTNALGQKGGDWHTEKKSLRLLLLLRQDALSVLLSLHLGTSSTFFFLNVTPNHLLVVVDKVIMSQSKKSDLEALPFAQAKAVQASSTTTTSEYNVPTRTKIAYLGVYFLCNVFLTIYNKAVLGKVGRASEVVDHVLMRPDG